MTAYSTVKTQAVHPGHKHRRKRRMRLLVSPEAQASQYPGFFVLPRAESAERSLARMLVTGLLVGLAAIAILAVFFALFGLYYSAPRLDLDNHRWLPSPVGPSQPL
ncbi:MAG: hypothetical protein IT579_18580 [Verrucomicrobia subdivision 3 bacterium]|nr:hypothetical protein [Verrucomicrobiota bacterium]MCC6822740.1 hypothetical protein [Limisphaerales bacterium]